MKLNVYKVRDHSLCDMCIGITEVAWRVRDNELDIMRVKWEEMRKNKVGVFCVPSTLKCFYFIINPVMTLILPFA